MPRIIHGDDDQIVPVDTSAGDLQPGAEAVAEATELRNITHTDAADPTVGIAWHRFSQNTERPGEHRAACPWGSFREW